jgi:hypothetical protein
VAETEYMKLRHQVCVLVTAALLVSFAATALVGGCGNGSGNRGIVDDRVHRDPFCGQTQPNEGDSCTAWYGCEYGGDSLGRYATYANCGGPTPDCQSTGCHWHLFANAAVSNAPDCPATYAEAAAQTSCPMSLGGSEACDYDEGRCGCTLCGWRCRERTDVRAENGPPGAVCPIARPLSGDGCAPDQVVCHYENTACPPDPLGFGSRMDCVGGYWVTGGGGSGGCFGPTC